MKTEQTGRTHCQTCNQWVGGVNAHRCGLDLEEIKGRLADMTEKWTPGARTLAPVFMGRPNNEAIAAIALRDTRALFADIATLVAEIERLSVENALLRDVAAAAMPLHERLSTGECDVSTAQAIENVWRALRRWIDSNANQT